jgi:hypothetical protein
MTRRLPVEPVPGPLVEYAARFDDLFDARAQREGSDVILRALAARRTHKDSITVVLTRVGGHRRVSDMNASEGSAQDAGSDTKLPARIQTRGRPLRPILSTSGRGKD